MSAAAAFVSALYFIASMWAGEGATPLLLKAILMMLLAIYWRLVEQSR